MTWKHVLWDICWALPKSLRYGICKLRHKHMGNWLGIMTLNPIKPSGDQDGFCALCAWGAYSPEFKNAL